MARLDREQVTKLAKDVGALLPDIARLFRDVVKDERVPRLVKAEVGAALVYVLSPIDLVPDFIPGVGQLDDLAVIAWAVRRLLLGAGEPVLRELWRGTDRSLDILLQLVSTGLRPRLLRRH